MRRGRKPKPSALDKLDGGASHRKRNAREPKPAASDATCPAWLRGDPLARAIWKSEAPLHIRLGTLTTVDRLAFAALCERAATYRRAALVLRDSLTREDKANGHVARAEVSISKGALEQLLKLAAAFGMTPSDRKGLEVDLGAGAARGGSGGAGKQDAPADGKRPPVESIDDFVARRAARRTRGPA